ncbi:hypothetical protein CSUB01_10792 [Colletotrichum sublineola]|uniref:Uncharacterized protein n=1 Tax=Colletotrichum sublineola TaxID=1173701 RepID=A0A066XNW7_COLSU|nr:hypothetical protein CSUB01_10792 [Colletotrichum sublineola]
MALSRTDSQTSRTSSAPTTPDRNTAHGPPEPPQKARSQGPSDQAVDRLGSPQSFSTSGSVESSRTSSKREGAASSLTSYSGTPARSHQPVTQHPFPSQVAQPDGLPAPGYCPRTRGTGSPGFPPSHANAFPQGTLPPPSGQHSRTRPISQTQGTRAPDSAPSDATARRPHMPPHPRVMPDFPPSGPTTWPGRPTPDSGSPPAGTMPTRPPIPAGQPNGSQFDGMASQFVAALMAALQGATRQENVTAVRGDHRLDPSVGIFWPDADAKTHGTDDIFYDGCATYYRDVELWTNAFGSLLPDRGTQDAVLSDLAPYLRGSARDWWECQLTFEERRLCITRGWVWTAARFRARFGPTMAEAAKWFRENHFTMEKVNGRAEIRAFAHDCFKHSRAWGDTTNRQWLARFYNNLAPQLRQFLREPEDFDTPDMYITVAEERRNALRDASTGSRHDPVHVTDAYSQFNTTKAQLNLLAYRASSPDPSLHTLVPSSGGLGAADDSPGAWSNST